MCLYPSHPQKLQFPPYHKWSVCAAAFVTFFIILSGFRGVFLDYLIPDTSLAQSLPPHFHLTLHFSERRCTSVLALFSLSPSLLPPIVSTLYPFLHVVGPDDCWGCVRNGGSLETGVHRFIMAVSLATIRRSKGSHTKDTPL